MSDPGYAKQHRIETRRVPQLLRYCDPGADPVVEYEDIVVSTATMSVDAFKACLAYAWVVQLCHSMNLTTVVAVYMQAAHGVAPSRFYEVLLEFAAASPDTLLGREYASFRAHSGAWVDRGASRDLTAPEFSEVVLDPEQIAFLDISNDFPRFFAELDVFLSFLERNRIVAIESSIRRDLLCLQEALVVKWKDGGSRIIQLRHALYEFFCAASCGETRPLRKGEFTVRVDDPYDFAGDRRRYAREIVIWGRRDGKTRYRSVSEVECVASAAAPVKRIRAGDEMIAEISHRGGKGAVRSRAT
jgi:putative methyltransferase